MQEHLNFEKVDPQIHHINLRKQLSFTEKMLLE